MIKYIIYWFVEATLLYVTINFETNFELKAQVHADGMIEICGLNRAGKEVFKYYLGSQCSSGVTSNKLSKHGSGPKEK